MNTTPHPERNSTWLIAILAVSLLFAPIAATAQADGEDDEEIYELSPFEVAVEDDRGYRATTTTAGTALDTLIRDLPMGLEVITSEFIEDQQALDFREALSYSAGVFFETHRDTTAATSDLSQVSDFEVRDRSPSGAADPENPFANAISIRGYTVPNQQRMGFRVGAIVPAYGVVLGGSTDTANTQRQEVVRGPQSLLYGINVLSGIVNIVPRRPTSENRTRVSATLGSHKLRRFTLDHGGPLFPGTLNYRVLGTYTERGTWQDFEDQKENYYVGQLDWFVTPNVRVFLEGQYSEKTAHGGGTQFFVDAGGDDFWLRNRYGQRYTFGRDFFNEDAIDEPHMEGQTVTLARETDLEVTYDVFGRPKHFQKPWKEYDYADLGPGYRISGPDVRREEEEYNLLGLIYLSPFEGLNVELGAYYTKTDIWQRQLNMGVFTNTMDTVRPAGFHEPPGDEWRKNPEADMEDPYGWGPGELFVAANPREDERGGVMTDRKYAYYSWYEQPTLSESLQLRGRVAYNFESGWIGGTVADHTLMAGVSNISDTVEFVAGGIPDRNYVYSTGTEANDFEDSKVDEDPLFFRNIFDYEPIRYTGQPLAIPGELSTANLPGLSGETTSVMRSGWIEADLSYRGYYGVYQGQMFDDRLTLVGGLRRDLYQVLEREQLRVLDRDRLSDDWMGSGDQIRTPHLIGYGDQPYTWRDDLPDALNEQVEADVDRLREQRPDGTVEYNFDRPQRFDTKTFGLSYRLLDDWSVYYLYSEGVFPNTGQRDGAFRPIEAEQTVSNEIGIKFDLFEDRVSGTISAYRIERENAVWHWQNAPAPGNWRGGPNHPGPETGDGFGPFYPDLVRDGELPILYGVAEHYLRRVYSHLGLLPDDPTPGDIRTFMRGVTFTPYGANEPGDWEHTTPNAVEAYGHPTFFMADLRYPRAMTDYMKMNEIDRKIRSGELDYWELYPHDPHLDEPRFAPGDTIRVGYEGHIVGPDEPGVDIEFGNPLRLAMELAVRDETELGDPIYWGYQVGNRGAFTASTERGANVRYEEKGQGVDGQLLFRPTTNYSVLFSFAWQKREVTDFILASPYRIDVDGNEFRDGPNDGLWSTEYDAWVWLLGPENFGDPRDPSTLMQGAIHGLDLSFVPRYSFRMWNKYEFRDNFLEGLEVGGGVRYNGPVPTAAEVGGARMHRNRFTTPDVPARAVYDAFIAYRSVFNDRIHWRVAFNVQNLTNDRESLATVSYAMPDDERFPARDDIHRRTRVFHPPRSYRLTVSLDF